MQFETKYHPPEYRGGEPSTSQVFDADSAAPDDTTDIVRRIAEAQKLALAAESDPAVDGPAGGHAAPLPNRPKGRLFIGFVLFAILAILVYVVWSTWFAFRAYGEVQGDVIHVCSVAKGMLEGVHVRAGDRVRQGQLLATVTDYEMLREIDRLTNGLLTVRANIELTQAELVAAKVRWSSSLSTERAEFYEASAVLAIEVAKLTEMQLNIERMKAVRERSANAISDQELLAKELMANGQAVRVEQLQMALDEQKKAVEEFGGVQEVDRLQPILTELEIVKHKLERARQSLKEGQITAPTNGCVLEILKHVGELADGSGIVTLLRDDSLLPVIYVSASQADGLRSGDVLDVRDSAGRMIACEVLRIGEAFQPPPARVTRYYGKFEVVRPVALRPLAAADRQRLVLGDQIVWPMWQPLAFLWAQVRDHEP